MSSKKQPDVSKKELRATIKKLHAKLGKADERAERLKAKAARHREQATNLAAEVRQLKEAARPPEQETSEPDTRAGSAGPDVLAPDSTWTVVRLRAEARSRGVAGATRMTKAQLLTALG